jgi:hypothetical protein
VSEYAIAGMYALACVEADDNRHSAIFLHPACHQCFLFPVWVAEALRSCGS